MNSLSLVFLVFFTSTPAELVAANRTGFTLEVSIPEISESEKNIEGNKEEISIPYKGFLSDKELEDILTEN